MQAIAEPILIRKNPSVSSLPQHGVPFLRHNVPDERRASLDDKIVSNLHEQIERPGLLGFD
jgi:hypothetical protein